MRCTVHARLEREWVSHDLKGNKVECLLKSNGDTRIKSCDIHTKKMETRMCDIYIKIRERRHSVFL